MNARAVFEPSFEIGIYDRVTIDRVDVKVVIDGKEGKVFEGDGFERPLVLTNSEIAKLLDDDALIVERDFYAPRPLLKAKQAPYLRDLFDRQQQRVRTCMEWITRFEAKRQQYSFKLTDEGMRPIMDDIRKEFSEDHLQAKANAEFKKTKRGLQTKIELMDTHARTLREWCRKYREAGDDWRVFIDARGSAEKKSQFSEEELDLQGRMVQRYLSRTKVKPSHLFKLMKIVERRLNKLRSESDKLDLGSRNPISIIESTLCRL